MNKILCPNKNFTVYCKFIHRCISMSLWDGFFIRKKPKTCICVPHYQICRIQKEEYEAVIEFLSKFYYLDDPLCSAARLSTASLQTWQQFVCECVTQGNSLVAKTDCGVPMGVAVNIKRTQCFQPNIVNPSDIECSLQYQDYLKFWTFAQQKLYSRCDLDLSCCFEILMVAVNPIYRNNHIATKLISESRKLGHCTGSSMLLINSTNYYISKICQKHGFERVFRMKFSEYCGPNNTRFFLPSPHQCFEVYVERFNCPKTYRNIGILDKILNFISPRS